MESISIRVSNADDVEAINSINNHYIINTHSFFEFEPIPIEQRQEWFTQFGPTGRHRLFVACKENGSVVGYCFSSPCSHQANGCVTSVESTVCLRPECTGKGVGKKLYEALFAALAKEDVHRVFARVILPNDASLRLHEKMGFQRVGYFTELGRKFGRYWDVVCFEKPL